MERKRKICGYPTCKEDNNNPYVTWNEECEIKGGLIVFTSFPPRIYY